MSVLKKTVVLAAIMIMALSLTLVGCGSNKAPEEPKTTGSAEAPKDAELKLITPGILAIGSDCDYPPFIFMEGEKVGGFEFELMTAIAQEMGVEAQYLPPQNFDSLIASVAAATKMDIGVSSFTITDERKELVDFCDPYFDSNQAAVAMKGEGYTSAMDFDGMTVGAQSGTTGADWVRENLPNATLKEFNQTSEGLASLVAGDIECLYFDEPVAVEQVKTTYTDCEIIEVIPTGEQYGFAISKDNPALRDAVNAALRTLIDNGTYGTIFAKYFEFEPTIK